MGTYRVDSVFRTREGRELRRMETFGGDAESAKDALARAFERMRSIVAEDDRIDMVVSTAHGPKGERVTSSDYADELGSGASCSGLTEETRPEDFAPAPTAPGDAGTDDRSPWDVRKWPIMNGIVPTVPDQQVIDIHFPEMPKTRTKYQGLIDRLVKVGPLRDLEKKAASMVLKMLAAGITSKTDDHGDIWNMLGWHEVFYGSKEITIEHDPTGKVFNFTIETVTPS